MMQFESLANELLFDLFEYLDTAHLLRAFTELNSRFNQLLSHHFRFHQLNFQFLSKEDFDQSSQTHLPVPLDQIIAFRLSNDETPDLPELLPSHGFILNRFLRLQSLSLYNIHSLQTLTKLIYQCRSLPHFTHLHIMKYDDGEIHLNIIDLLNTIWNLPKLIYCNLNGIIHTNEISLSKISTTSSCIEHLLIENIPCNLTSLSHLFDYTPSLQRLATTLYSYLPNDHLTSLMPRIEKFNLFFGGSLESMKNLLQNLPYLSHLTINTSQIYLDGHIWQELILHYLPTIKIFQLKMDLDFQQSNDDIEDIIDELLQTFQSSFWIEEHQWYVRCHWNPSDPYKSTTLYTLPYAFDTYDFSNKSCTKSTCFDQQQYWSYDRVQIVGHSNIDDNLSHSFSLLRARFPHIHHLYINLPFDDMFWLRFSSFDHLKSLTVSLYKSSAYCQLQTLLNQSPCLYSLKIESFVGLSIRLFQLTSPSIRRLDLIDILVDQSIYFNRKDCLTLIDSSWGSQCEILLIRIQHRTMIIELIERMSHLRLIIFECEDEKESFGTSSSSSRNELIQWLKHYLPSTYSISTDPRRQFRIRIWINRTERKTLPTDLIFKNKNRLSQALTLFRRFFS